MKLVNAMPAIADALDDAAEELAELDSVAGDGDLGVTARRIATQIRASFMQADNSTGAQILRVCALGISEAAPSSFGTLLSFGLLAAAKVLSDNPGASPEDVTLWREALKASCKSVSDRGGAVAGQRTVLDAAIPAADALHSALPFRDAVAASALAAQAGADQTAQMKPSVGRAGWSGDRGIGHVDGGARLFAVAWAALARAVDA